MNLKGFVRFKKRSANQAVKRQKARFKKRSANQTRKMQSRVEYIFIAQAYGSDPWVFDQRSGFVTDAQAVEHAKMLFDQLKERAKGRRRDICQLEMFKKVDAPGSFFYHHDRSKDS